MDREEYEAMRRAERNNSLGDVDMINRPRVDVDQDGAHFIYVDGNARQAQVIVEYPELAAVMHQVPPQIAFQNVMPSPLQSHTPWDRRRDGTFSPQGSSVAISPHEAKSILDKALHENYIAPNDLHALNVHCAKVAQSLGLR